MNMKMNFTSLCGLFNKSPTEILTSCQTWSLRSQVITTIDLENCTYTLGANLTTSHQVDYLSEALISPDGVENDQNDQENDNLVAVS